MLVLSRRVGEQLVIGGDIVLTVIEVRGDGVRLGIDAPRSVRVHRAEILDAVRSANAEAAGADDGVEAALRRLVPVGPAAPATPPEGAGEAPAMPAEPASPAAATPAQPASPAAATPAQPAGPGEPAAPAEA